MAQNISVTQENYESGGDAGLGVPDGERIGVATDRPVASHLVQVTGKIGDAPIHGALDQDILARAVEISLGASKDTPPGKWNTDTFTIKEVLDSLAEHRVGIKDGKCYLQGAIARGDRSSTAMKHADLVVVDLDNGEPLASVHTKVRKLGWLALVYSTHSHGAEVSEIGRDALVKFAGGDGVDDPTLADAVAYLTKKKGYHPAVLDGATLGDTEHGSRGVMMRVRHGPMTKCRIVLFLKNRFSFSEGGTQKARIAEWKARYAGVAQVLDIHMDKSCDDPARLFYMPRHKAGAPFQVDIFPGALLDLNQVPRVSGKGVRDDNPFTRTATAMGAPKTTDADYTTTGLVTFFAKHGGNFDLADFLLEVDPDGDRGTRTNGPGRTHKCPNDDAHTDAGNPDDKGFFCINGLDNEEHGAFAKCMHSACADLDRINFVDLACKEAGITDASGLLKWVPEVEWEDGEKEADDLGFAEYAAEVSALMKGDAKGAEELARRIGGTLAFSPVEVDSLLSTIKDRTGVGKLPLKAAAKSAAEAVHQVRQGRARDAGEADAAAARKEGRFVWPDGFKVQGGRLGYMREGGDNGPVFAPMCDVFTPLGVERGEDGDGFALLLGFTDRTGRGREESILLRDVAQNPGEVLGRLADAGLWFVAKREAKDKLAECLAALQVPNVITKVARPGWHAAGDGTQVFICPRGEVIGGRMGDHDSTRGAFRLAAGAGAKDTATVGTLDGWKQAAAAAFATPENYHWPVGVLAGFAGTLVQLAGVDTCGVNLSGRTSKGKTTAQALAASAWANPKEGRGVLATFRSTANALEGLAKAATGTVLALDELGQADPRQVGQALFMLAGGAGKVRMTRDLATRAPATFSTFALMSGEQGLRAVVEGARETYAAGMAVRFPDVDVTDTRDVTPAEFAAVNACRAHYGHAGAVFVRHLIASGLAGDAGGLKGSIDALAGEIAGEGAAAPRRRSAVPFAIMRRAGEIVIDAGLLPHDADVVGAVGRAWTAYLGGSEAEMMDGAAVAIDRLRTALHAGWDTAVLDTSVDGNSGSYRGPRAWYNADKGSIYIPVDNLREFTGQGFKAAAVTNDLAAKGWLQKQGNNAAWEVIPKMGKMRHYRLSYEEFAPDKACEA